MTWEAVGPSFQDGYYQVIGDGNVLYAQESNTGANSVGPQPYITSPETDGATWTPYQGGSQTFADGPLCMRFDSIRRILYSSNWRTGIWALKVLVIGETPGEGGAMRHLRTGRRRRAR